MYTRYHLTGAWLVSGSLCIFDDNVLKLRKLMLLLAFESIFLLNQLLKISLFKTSH